MPHHPEPDNLQKTNKRLSRQHIPVETTTQWKAARWSSPFSGTLPWVGTNLLLWLLDGQLGPGPEAQGTLASCTGRFWVLAAQLWEGPGEFYLVCHALEVGLPDGCDQQPSHLDQGRSRLPGWPGWLVPCWTALASAGRSLGDEHHCRSRGSVRGCYSICESRGTDVSPCS